MIKLLKKAFASTLALCFVLTTITVAPVTNVSAASSNIISDGWYYIKNVYSQKYVEVASGIDKDGANVQQWQGNGYDCQKWYVRNLGNGYISLQNGMAGGRMMDIVNGENKDGSNAQIWTSNNLDPQKFKVKKSSNGAVCLLTKNSNCKKALDVYDWSKDNGGNIDQWTYNGLECQQFKFERTDGKSQGGSSSSGNTPISGKTINVSASGTSLESAVKSAKAGTTIVISGTVKSGTIKLPAGVNIAGTNNATVDFSKTSGSNGKGFYLAENGSTISNIIVKNAADNGIFVTGSHNTFKNVTCCNNHDAGFQVSNGGAYNTFENCHSHHNADAAGENADGFAVKLHSGVGNVFKGCVAEYNSDDGWDCYAAHGAVKLYNCHANYNGYCNGIYGDGNGFKMGGVDNKTPGQKAHLDPLNHYLEGCVAKGNLAAGFDRNNQSGVVTMKNCTGDSNKKGNYNWPATGKPSALGYKVTFGKAIIDSCTSINGKNDISGATLKGNCKGF